MQIRDLLEKKGKILFAIKPDATINEAIQTLNDKHIGALIVLKEDGHTAGLLSERDILRNLDALNTGKKVKDIMTPKENLIIGHEHDEVEYVMGIFTQNKIRHLPIIEDEKVIGMISIGDTVKSLLDNAEFENKNLMDYITGTYPT